MQDENGESDVRYDSNGVEIVEGVEHHEMNDAYEDDDDDGFVEEEEESGSSTYKSNESDTTSSEDIDEGEQDEPGAENGNSAPRPAGSASNTATLVAEDN